MAEHPSARKPASQLVVALRRCIEEALEADRREAAERAQRRAKMHVVDGGRRAA